MLGDAASCKYSDHCRGDVNPRTTKKPFVIEDVSSGTVYLDILQDYSVEAVFVFEKVWVIKGLVRNCTFGSWKSIGVS